MSKKELYMGKPIIRSYHSSADLFSIISRNTKYRSWLFNNFILLETPPNDNRLDYVWKMGSIDTNCWDYCPFVSHSQIKPNYYNKFWNGNYIKMIIDFIDNNFYMHITHDTYHISQSIFYHKTHYYHDLFIYGYDTQEKCVMVCEYYNGRYSHYCIPFAELQCSLQDSEDADFSLSILQYQDAHYIFDINSMIFQLECQLCSSVPNQYKVLQPHTANYIFGLSTYAKLISYISLRGCCDDNTYDSRPLYVLWEHKKLMLARLNFICENNYIKDDDYTKLLDECRILEKLAFQLWSLDLILSLKKDKKIFSVMEKNIKIIKEKEKLFLIHLLSTLGSSRGTSLYETAGGHQESSGWY